MGTDYENTAYLLVGFYPYLGIEMQTAYLPNVSILLVPSNKFNYRYVVKQLSTNFSTKPTLKQGGEGLSELYLTVLTQNKDKNRTLFWKGPLMMRLEGFPNQCLWEFLHPISKIFIIGYRGKYQVIL